MYQSGRAMTSEQLKERIKLLNIVGIALPVFFVAGAAAFFCGKYASDTACGRAALYGVCRLCRRAGARGKAQRV